MSVFFQMSSIGLFGDPMCPTVAQRRVVLNSACFVFETEVRVDRKVEGIEPAETPKFNAKKTRTTETPYLRSLDAFSQFGGKFRPG
jgi:hypothetical protein